MGILTGSNEDCPVPPLSPGMPNNLLLSPVICDQSVLK